MHLNNIPHLLKEIEQTLGMPLWAVLIISALCILLIFFAVFIPISIMKIRKKLDELIQDLSGFQETVNKKLQNQSSKYRWKT